MADGRTRIKAADFLRGRGRRRTFSLTPMNDHVYKTIELTATSTRGMEDAINNALARAGKTVLDLRWFQVLETRGEIEGSKVGRWQVTLKVGFTLEDA
jgi:flavin-binding protein dodecin